MRCSSYHSVHYPPGRFLAPATIAGLLALVGSAGAEPIGVLSPYRDSVNGTVGEPPGGYGPRTNPFRGVVPFDHATTGIFMYDGNLVGASVNSGGNFDVQRGLTNTDIGSNRNGTGRVQALWDEVIIGNVNTIRCAISTTNNEPLVPAGSMVPLPGGGSSPAVFWSWQFGTVDPVNFQNWVTNVRLNRASISFSADGGQSYFNTITHTNTIPNRANWNPGSDDGELLASVGDGTNFVLLQYQIEVVPTPGAIALLTGGLITISRRRR